MSTSDSKDNTSVEPLVYNEIDYTQFFTTSQIFSSKEDLVAWVREVGKLNCAVVVIVRTVKGTESVRGKVWLGCEKSGTYKGKKVSDPEKQRRGGTKKCGCPFSLKGIEQDDGRWIVHVLNGTHNHNLPVHSEGHAFVGRLTNAEFHVISEMTKSHVRPKEILQQIKRNNEENASTIKHIYNARQKLKMEDMGDRLVLQQLLNQTQEYNYFEWHRKELESDVLSDVMFAHPMSVSLLQVFPYVLIIDVTYKTNRYKMPFLEIIGFTSTHKNFSVAFAFISSEKVDNYIWVMQHVRQLFQAGIRPVVIATNRDIALVNAVEEVFPEVTHLLCWHHIYKNIEDKCTKVTSNKDIVIAFVRACKKIVEAKDENMYHAQLSSLESDYRDLTSVLSYVKDTWLSPYKERIVAAWTDQITHFGIHKMKGVENVHSRLKRFLGSSRGSLDAILSKLHSLVELQLIEIRRTFEQSRTSVPHIVTGKIYRHLRGHVSHKALELLVVEANRAKEVGTNVMACGCYMRRTHGLPCAHELATYISEDLSIPLHDIHLFWKQLDMEVACDTLEATIEG